MYAKCTLWYDAVRNFFIFPCNKLRLGITGTQYLCLVRR